MKPEQVLSLSNDDVTFQLSADGTADFRNLCSGVNWHMTGIAFQCRNANLEEGVWYNTERSFAEEYPGRFIAKRQGSAVRFTLLGRLGVEQGKFTCRITLDGSWLEFRILEIDEKLPSLMFPPALEAEKVVVPLDNGRLIQQDCNSLSRNFWPAFNSMSMRWFGGLRGEDGWIAVFSEGYCYAGLHLLGRSASPGWLKRKGRWKGPRVVRYRHTDNGYVGMAKVYRQWAKDNGLFCTLKEKIAATPALSNLVGGRILSCHHARSCHREIYDEVGLPVPADFPGENKLEIFARHKDIARLIRRARALGMQRGIVNIRGWIRGGYDESHPDVWPPEPALGTLAELRKNLHAGFVGVLHDNYQDIYRQNPSFPKGVMKTSWGELAAAGLWWGGQAYLVCSSAGLQYAKRNWRKIKSLQPGGMFIDTTTALPFYECYHPDHPMVREDDERNKLELLCFYKSQGLIAGSETGRDYAIPAIDFFENRDQHIPGQSVPLFPLVFHDCVFEARYVDPMGADPSGQGAPNMLADILWGYLCHWGTYMKKEIDGKTFKASLAVDACHARVGTAEMLNHKFLTSDNLVEKTEFSSGQAVICNFARESRKVEGVTVPAGKHVILD